MYIIHINVFSIYLVFSSHHRIHPVFIFDMPEIQYLATFVGLLSVLCKMRKKIYWKKNVLYRFVIKVIEIKNQKTLSI